MEIWKKMWVGVFSEHSVHSFSEWTTVETAQGTDVRHSAGNFGVSEVQQCCTGACVPLDLTQVINSPGHLRATQTTAWRQKTVSLIALSLWHCSIKCSLHEPVQQLSYFFLLLSYLAVAPRNLKRSLNVFWRQVLVNNTAIHTMRIIQLRLHL